VRAADHRGGDVAGGHQDGAEVEPPPVWQQKRLVLRITEEDGLGGRGRVSEVLLDPTFDGWPVVETTASNCERPWEREEVQAHIGLRSVRSLELVDVDPDDGSAWRLATCAGPGLCCCPWGRKAPQGRRGPVSCSGVVLRAGSRPPVGRVGVSGAGGGGFLREARRPRRFLEAEAVSR
jgi:hypothetical protein